MSKSFAELLLICNGGCDAFCNNHKFYSWCNVVMAVWNCVFHFNKRMDNCKKGHCKYTTRYLAKCLEPTV